MTQYPKIEAVLIADTPGTFVTRLMDRAELIFGGIHGDRHFGITAKADVRQPMYPRGTEIMNRRQLSLVSVEELREVANRLGVEEIKPEWLGANLVVSGLPELSKLPIGLRMLLPSGAGLVCEGENEPCTGPGKQIANYYGDNSLTHRFVKEAQQLRGIVAYVERPGDVKAGDEIKLV
ncbi:MOSC domain-containing protein [Paenibacillus hexagrammi]|uniref:MOSC domain-containing protein n=1 Tax=Paenibacillus hexagrammi TaxID=2908839 RepID=A0ABY3SSD2_9BACL|nr:MOSC domain-containing protein [Paenibacillus sp. YPD9-1]UJF35892.1 MOSC domain-containing protein [Paenibacillus sp. YPD9-1]